MDSRTKMATCNHHTADREKDYCSLLNAWYGRGASKSWPLWNECKNCTHHDNDNTQPHESRKNPPTEKQISFANAISSELGVGLPKEKTRQSLFLFIQEHRPAYDNRMLERSRKHTRRRRSFDWSGVIDRDDDLDMADALGIDIMTGCLGD